MVIILDGPDDDTDYSSVEHREYGTDRRVKYSGKKRQSSRDTQTERINPDYGNYQNYRVIRGNSSEEQYMRIAFLTALTFAGAWALISMYPPSIIRQNPVRPSALERTVENNKTR